MSAAPEETEEGVARELGELRAILITVDKLLGTLKRLNATISAGGDLNTAQRDLLEVLAGRKRLKVVSDQAGSGAGPANGTHARHADEDSIGDPDDEEEEDEGGHS
jgi:hypothetical protein